MGILERAAIDTFAADGFVVTPALLSADELREYGAAVDQAVASRTVSDARSLSEKSSYEQSFVQCMRLWETDAAVRPLTFHRRLAQAASELLGVTAVRLWQDQALYKEPGGRITDPHQDATFWPIGDAPLVTAWIPFDAVTIANGAMGYVPGSHRLGRLRPVNLTRTTEAYDILNDPALDGATPRFVEVEAGSVIWHHGLTIHQAAENHSDQVRRAFTIVYVADGFRRVSDRPAFPLDRAGVAVGDPIAGEGLPLAWPRSDDDHPEPPAMLGSPTGPQVRSAPQ